MNESQFGTPQTGAIQPPPQGLLPDLTSGLQGLIPEMSDRAPRRLLLWVVGGAVALEIGIRGGFANAIVVLGLLMLAAALLTDQRIQRRSSRWLVVASILPTLGLAVRASPWLTASNLAAALGLMTVAILQSRSGDVFDTTLGRLARRLPAALWRAVCSPALLTGLVPRLQPATGRRVTQIGLAVVIAVPLLGIVVALLAVADPVFAGLVSPDVDIAPEALVEHLVLAGFFAGALLMTVAAALGDGDDGRHRGQFGVAATATMLGLAASVLTLFVVAQLVALTEAGDRLIEEADLTPAEYARSGFFQLCWATAFLLLFLGVVSWLAAPEVKARREIRVLAALVPLLTVGLVVVSLRRMALYDQAFGLTMLRLWVVLAALWMGAVLLMIAARSLGVGGDREWVFGGTVIAATVLVVAADVFNPEAFVVHHNADRAAQGQGEELDLEYLTGLSDDAVPALVDELGADAFTLEVEWYRDHSGTEKAMRCDDETTGVAALNLAVARADDVRDETCAAEAP
jgi:hypothetical protein